MVGAKNHVGCAGPRRGENLHTLRWQVAASAGACYHRGMDVVAHGVDMVECSRIKEMKDRYGKRFLQRVFTKTELQYCLGKKREVEHLAGRFAVKEAVLKVLGTGWRRGINWTDIEVVNEPSGQPRVRLSGRCRELADQRGLGEILISISHIETHAIASAIATAAGPTKMW